MPVHKLEMVIDEPLCGGAGDHLMGGGWDPSSSSDMFFQYALAQAQS